MPFTRIWIVFFLVATAGIVLYSAVLADSAAGPVNATAGGVNLPRDGRPFERLSEYNLFQDFATQTPNTGVVPYDVATPLFTDYASKYRFVYMPDGQSAQYDPEHMFEYPVGTILVKTFGYLNDIRDESQGEQLIETRLLIRGRWSWDAWTYVYDEAAEDAVFTVEGARRQVRWTHYDGHERSINYIVPSVKDCRSCHNARYEVVPIGPKAWNLNRDFEYDHGTENQLAHWTKIGFLEGAPAPETAPALPLWEDETDGTLDERARAYLEVNCAHCHNPNGPADESGLDLRWIQNDPYALGVGRRLTERGGDRDGPRWEERGRDWDGGRREVGDRDRDRRRRADRDRDRNDRGREKGNRDFGAGDFDPGGRVFDIVPGKPDESIMVYRMESLVPEITMPKVPHHQIHEEGVALIREWILAMDEVDPESQ